MNYAQYQILKGKYEKQARIFSIIPLIILIGMVFHLIILISKTNININYLNILMIEQLYSNGKVYMGEDNVVMAFLFFGFIALLLFVFSLCTFFCKKNVKIAYSILVFLYGIDFCIAVIGRANHEAFVHFIFLIGLIYARRICSHLEAIPENIWGDWQKFVVIL